MSTPTSHNRTSYLGITGGFADTHVGSLGGVRWGPQCVVSIHCGDRSTAETLCWPETGASGFLQRSPGPPCTWCWEALVAGPLPVLSPAFTETGSISLIPHTP